MDNLKEIQSFRDSIHLDMDYLYHLLKHSAILEGLKDWERLGYVAMDSAHDFSKEFRFDVHDNHNSLIQPDIPL